MTPAWIPDIFAALMLAAAAVSAARLVAVRPWRHGPAAAGIDVAHLFMGIAMAGTVAPSLTTLPYGAWAAVFGLLTTWFACLVMRDARAAGPRALAGGHCATHLMHSAVMLYMFFPVAAAAASAAGMSASGPAMHAVRFPFLGFVLALILAGYTVWDLDQLSSGRYRLTTPPAGGGDQKSPPPAAATVGCRIAIGVTMAYMLLIMI